MNIRFSNSNSKPTQFATRMPIRTSNLGLNIPMISRIYASNGCSSCGNK